MSGKLKILLVALAALILVGAIAVPIAAEDTPTPTPTASSVDFLERVAQKLGTTKDTLVTAMKEAKEEIKALDPKPEPPTLWDTFVEKVAGKLGKTKDELVTAFQQTAVELREEALTKSLEKAVAKGLITPDEAEDIKTWYASRPAAVDKLLNIRGLFKCWRFQAKLGNGLRQRVNTPAPQSYFRGFQSVRDTPVY
ncbi:MAG: hypothetical protein V1894_00040 [Chloroflexota bacterium]